MGSVCLDMDASSRKEDKPFSVHRRIHDLSNILYYSVFTVKRTVDVNYSICVGLETDVLSCI